MNSSSLYKGILQPVIMQLLKEQGRMYGFEITQKVKALTKGELKITEGALYPLLHKMESDGLLDSKQEYVEKRMRKYYSLTSKGRKQTSTALHEISGLVSNLTTIFKLKLA